MYYSIPVSLSHTAPIYTWLSQHIPRDAALAWLSLSLSLSHHFAFNEDEKCSAPQPAVTVLLTVTPPSLPPPPPTPTAIYQPGPSRPWVAPLLLVLVAAISGGMLLRRWSARARGLPPPTLPTAAAATKATAARATSWVLLRLLLLRYLSTIVLSVLLAVEHATQALLELTRGSLRHGGEEAAGLPGSSSEGEVADTEPDTEPEPEPRAPAPHPPSSARDDAACVCIRPTLYLADAVLPPSSSEVEVEVADTDTEPPAPASSARDDAACVCIRPTPYLADLVLPPSSSEVEVADTEPERPAPRPHPPSSARDDAACVCIRPTLYLSDLVLPPSSSEVEVEVADTDTDTEPPAHLPPSSARDDAACVRIRAAASLLSLSLSLPSQSSSPALRHPRACGPVPDAPHDDGDLGLASSSSFDEDPEDADDVPGPVSVSASASASVGEYDAPIHPVPAALRLPCITDEHPFASLADVDRARDDDEEEEEEGGGGGGGGVPRTEACRQDSLSAPCPAPAKEGSAENRNAVLELAVVEDEPEDEDVMEYLMLELWLDAEAEREDDGVRKAVGEKGEKGEVQEEEEEVEVEVLFDAEAEAAEEVGEEGVEETVKEAMVIEESVVVDTERLEALLPETLEEQGEEEEAGEAAAVVADDVQAVKVGAADIEAEVEMAMDKEGSPPVDVIVTEEVLQALDILDNVPALDAEGEQEDTETARLVDATEDSTFFYTLFDIPFADLVNVDSFFFGLFDLPDQLDEELEADQDVGDDIDTTLHKVEAEDIEAELEMEMDEQGSPPVDVLPALQPETLDILDNVLALAEQDPETARLVDATDDSMFFYTLFDIPFGDLIDVDSFFFGLFDLPDQPDEEIEAEQSSGRDIEATVLTQLIDCDEREDEDECVFYNLFDLACDSNEGQDVDVNVAVDDTPETQPEAPSLGDFSGESTGEVFEALREQTEEAVEAVDGEAEAIEVQTKVEVDEEGSPLVDVIVAEEVLQALQPETLDILDNVPALAEQDTETAQVVDATDDSMFFYTLSDIALADLSNVDSFFFGLFDLPDQLDEGLEAVADETPEEQSLGREIDTTLHKAEAEDIEAEAEMEVDEEGNPPVEVLSALQPEALNILNNVPALAEQDPETARLVDATDDSMFFYTLFDIPLADLIDVDSFFFGLFDLPDQAAEVFEALADETLEAHQDVEEDIDTAELLPPIDINIDCDDAECLFYNLFDLACDTNEGLDRVVNVAVDDTPETEPEAPSLGDFSGESAGEIFEVLREQTEEAVEAVDGEAEAIEVQAEVEVDEEGGLPVDVIVEKEAPNGLLPETANEPDNNKPAPTQDLVAECDIDDAKKGQLVDAFENGTCTCGLLDTPKHAPLADLLDVDSFFFALFDIHERSLEVALADEKLGGDHDGGEDVDTTDSALFVAFDEDESLFYGLFELPDETNEEPEVDVNVADGELPERKAASVDDSDDSSYFGTLFDLLHEGSNGIEICEVQIFESQVLTVDDVSAPALPLGSSHSEPLIGNLFDLVDEQLEVQMAPMAASPEQDHTLDFHDTPQPTPLDDGGSFYALDAPFYIPEPAPLSESFDDNSFVLSLIDVLAESAEAADVSYDQTLTVLGSDQDFDEEYTLASSFMDRSSDSPSLRGLDDLRKDAEDGHTPAVSSYANYSGDSCCFTALLDAAEMPVPDKPPMKVAPDIEEHIDSSFVREHADEEIYDVAYSTELPFHEDEVNEAEAALGPTVARTSVQEQCNVEEGKKFILAFERADEELDHIAWSTELPFHEEDDDSVESNAHEQDPPHPYVEWRFEPCTPVPAIVSPFLSPSPSTVQDVEEEPVDANQSFVLSFPSALISDLLETRMEEGLVELSGEYTRDLIVEEWSTAEVSLGGIVAEREVEEELEELVEVVEEEEEEEEHETEQEHEFGCKTHDAAVHGANDDPWGEEEADENDQERQLSSPSIDAVHAVSEGEAENENHEEPKMKELEIRDTLVDNGADEPECEGDEAYDESLQMPQFAEDYESDEDSIIASKDEESISDWDDEIYPDFFAGAGTHLGLAFTTVTPRKPNASAHTPIPSSPSQDSIVVPVSELQLTALQPLPSTPARKQYTPSINICSPSPQAHPPPTPPPGTHIFPAFLDFAEGISLPSPSPSRSRKPSSSTSWSPAPSSPSPASSTSSLPSPPKPCRAPYDPGDPDTSLDMEDILAQCEGYENLMDDVTDWPTQPDVAEDWENTPASLAKLEEMKEKKCAEQRREQEERKAQQTADEEAALQAVLETCRAIANLGCDLDEEELRNSPEMKAFEAAKRRAAELSQRAKPKEAERLVVLSRATPPVMEPVSPYRLQQSGSGVASTEATGKRSWWRRSRKLA
ncbi:hypothetical protein LshimejAT787_0600120 [Lyophyllum shimeji]|uniref:Uncharacterized protein n=1 Tax=Lyophyllum shimeji TaxID=47721 RepID=A0A9P3PM33_LYOSH|nr:hypothetical protein LshimejAT787_0600120 [Lyophyllum shimeji]